MDVVRVCLPQQTAPRSKSAGAEIPRRMERRRWERKPLDWKKVGPPQITSKCGRHDHRDHRPTPSPPRRARVERRGIRALLLPKVDLPSPTPASTLSARTLNLRRESVRSIYRSIGRVAEASLVPKCSEWKTKEPRADGGCGICT